MRTLRNSLTALAITIGLTAAVNAADGDAAKSAEAPKELKNQTNCPVMGGKIDSTAFTDIQGQRVYHCCPMCSAKLKADPDKYFKKAAEEGILFENIQTTCPVSGHKLQDKSISTDYEGRHLAFCSNMCRDKFAENPAEFLKKMDAANSSEADSTSMGEMDMMHHGNDEEHHN